MLAEGLLRVDEQANSDHVVFRHQLVAGIGPTAGFVQLPGEVRRRGERGREGWGVQIGRRQRERVGGYLQGNLDVRLPRVHGFLRRQVRVRVHHHIRGIEFHHFLQGKGHQLSAGFLRGGVCWAEVTGLGVGEWGEVGREVGR